jgi:hypothetical protein
VHIWHGHGSSAASCACAAPPAREANDRIDPSRPGALAFFGPARPPAIATPVSAAPRLRLSMLRMSALLRPCPAAPGPSMSGIVVRRCSRSARSYAAIHTPRPRGIWSQCAVGMRDVPMSGFLYGNSPGVQVAIAFVTQHAWHCTCTAVTPRAWPLWTKDRWSSKNTVSLYATFRRSQIVVMWYVLALPVGRTTICTRRNVHIYLGCIAVPYNGLQFL